MPTAARPWVVAGTIAANPYRWPYHGSWDLRRSALVACVDRRWRPDGPLSDERDANLALVAATVRAGGGTVVALTATTSRRRAPAAPAAYGLPEAVADRSPPSWLAADETLSAAATSGFYGSRLEEVLRVRGCRDLLVAGWGLEGPVHSTLRAANDRGYECLLVADASVPFDVALGEAGCRMVRFSGGIFGAFAQTVDVVTAARSGADQTAAPSGADQ